MRLDAHTWRVVLSDGSSLYEYDTEHPDGRAWNDVSSKPIAGIILSEMYRVVIPPTASPFFTRRMTATQGKDENDIKACIIGWRIGQEGVYMFILEDGSTLLTNDLQAL